MTRRFRRLAAASLVASVLVAGAAARGVAGDQPTRKEADSFQQKLALVARHAESRRTAPRATPVSEGELNAYLQHHAEVPPGLLEPSVRLLGDGRLAGRAIVDLDAVREQGNRGWLNPLGYLSGRLPVTATGILRTRDGVGRFELESAEISGVAVPKSVLQELLTFYSRTPEHPQGVGLEEPFALPARIREIQLGKGQALIVQ